jgi:hypothetical protein
LNLEVSSLEQEGIFQASKWLKYFVLCSGSELCKLMQKFDPLWIYPLAGFSGGRLVAPSLYVDELERWPKEIIQSKGPDSARLRTFFPAALVDDPSALWLQEVSQGHLVKIRKPVLQMQIHHFIYSHLTHAIYPMAMGQQAIFWGLLLTYPQVYQVKGAIYESFQDPRSRTRAWLTDLRAWMRRETVLAPLVVPTQGPLCHTLRLGKECLGWIHKHPGLKELQIRERSQYHQ